MAMNIFISGFLLSMIMGNFLVSSLSIFPISIDQTSSKKTSITPNDVFSMSNSTTLKNSKKYKRVKLYATPNTVYLEILCIVDYSTYKLHGKNYGYTRDYYTSYWKAVDQYFQLLEKPRVQIILTDVIILRNKTSVMNVSNILKRMGDNKYFQVYTKYENEFLFNYPHHDIAVFITNYNLFDITSDDVFHQVTGKTFTGGACSTDHEKGITKSVAIVQDDGITYQGIRKTISLIGELLGAVEDGSPGAESCDSNDGFIMSSMNTFDAPFKFNWSNCSIKNIHKFLNNKPSLASSLLSHSQSKSNNPTCLFNKPHNLKINLTNHWLPGQVLSLDDYCEKLTGIFGACYQYQVSHCASMLCRDMYNQCTKINWGRALEGSWCHDDKRCHRGQCVPFPFQDTTPDDDDSNTTFIENNLSPLDKI